MSCAIIQRFGQCSRVGGGGGGFDLEWLRTKPSSVINNYWQKRFGDGGRRNGPSGLDKSLDELVTDKQSKTEYTQNADVV